MPDGFPPDASRPNQSLALSLKERIDRICDRFEAAWKSGQRPQIEALIARSGGRPRTELLRELLALECEYRARLGEQPAASEYDARFPGDMAVVREAFDKVSVSMGSVRSASGAETIDWSSSIGGESPAEPAANVVGLTTGSPGRSAAASPRKTLGRFEMLELLGRGSFGSVYKAHDPQLDRYVALKIPHAGTISGPADAARFLREARAAGQLRHPYIVPVFDAGQVASTYYIACAYIEGTALRRALQAGRFDNPREAAELIRKLAAALNYAHEQGIVHRDVKPENILVDASGNPYVLDFGLARRDDADATRTLDGTVMGTPVYMSPEQAAGKSHLADGRSDQWSLGVILYELLCGSRPFTGTGAELYADILQKQPLAPRKRKPTIPRDLETITLKCVAKEPAQRYGTCADLADDLQHWRDDEPIRARRTNWVERAWRWAKRNPGLAAACGLVLLLAIASTLSAVGLHAARQTVEKQLTALQSEVEARREAEQAVKQREAEVRQKQQQLAAHEAALRQRDTELVEKDTMLAARGKVVQEREVALRQVTAELQVNKSELDVKKRELATVAESRDAALQTAPWLAYISHLAQAQQHLLDQKPDLAQRSLEACPKEFRNCEWLWMQALCQEKAVYQWKSEPPDPGASYSYMFELSPNGLTLQTKIQTFVPGSESSSTRIVVDACTGNVIESVAVAPALGSNNDVRYLGFAANGDTFAKVSDDAVTVFRSTKRAERVFTVAARRHRTARAQLEYMRFAVFNSKGSELLVVSQSAVAVRDKSRLLSAYSVPDGKKLWETRINPTTSFGACWDIAEPVFFAGREEVWLAGTDGEHRPSYTTLVRFFENDSSGSKRFQFQQTGCESCCESVRKKRADGTWEADSRRFWGVEQRRWAIAPSYEFVVTGQGRVYETKHWTEVYRISMPIRPLVFSPDGARLVGVAESNKALVVLDASSEAKDWRPVITFDERLFPAGPVFQLSRDCKHAVGITADGVLHGWGLAE